MTGCEVVTFYGLCLLYQSINIYQIIAGISVLGAQVVARDSVGVRAHVQTKASLPGLGKTEPGPASGIACCPSAAGLASWLLLSLAAAAALVRAHLKQTVPATCWLLPLR